ncbi:FHA domain-containing protein [Lentzea sp. NBC_00516]|uniref:FHA domain-containing protein n=1 Tax=Lentzea sp. NBC_00516 TaxID=2903582 RepID=UPI002E8015A3|nr:FHA domain-containing protein [Lentzea sp. NBC_00516]WUD29265.1 FHA domain-containing protein [Lentzea sp. NBC_00516]
MTEVEYVPGTWVAVVGERTWLLLAVAPESALVRRCWELVRSDEPLDEVLSAIVLEGFRAVSGFALLTANRAVVRGEARLQVMNAAGAVEEITAAGVGTWVDRNLDDVARLRVVAGVSGPGLPVRAGVVLANELLVAVSDTAPQPVPQSVPVPQPVPVPVEHIVVQQEEAVELTVVREQPAPPPTSTQITQVTGVIQSFDWAPQNTPAATPAPPVPARQPVTETVLRTTMMSPNDTQMLQGTRTGLVRARKCPAGHLSSDYAVYCRVCEVPLPEQVAAMLPVPVLGLLRLSTGDTISLDRNVVMGRDPSGDRGGVNLVQVGRENDTEISRTHVEIRPANWDVLVRDLGSMNGTSISRPGCPPEKLAPHIDEILYPGTRVTLGDQFFFVFEVSG